MLMWTTSWTATYSICVEAMICRPFRVYLRLLKDQRGTRSNCSRALNFVMLKTQSCWAWVAPAAGQQRLHGNPGGYGQ